MQTGIILHQAAVEKLAPQEQKMILAGQGLPLKSESYPIAVSAITDLITSVFVIAGQPVPEHPALPILVQEFYSKLIETYPGCRLEEIRIALRKGVYDELGKYYGLNAKSFIQFVRSYLSSEERIAAKEKYKNAQKPDEQPRRPTPKYHTLEYWEDDKIQAWMTTTEQCYVWFLEDNAMQHATPEAVYWLLKHAGMIVVPEHYKIALIASGKKAYRSEVLQNYAKRHPDEISRILAAIESGGDPETDRAIHAAGRRQAIFNFFRRQQKNGAANIFHSREGITSIQNIKLWQQNSKPGSGATTAAPRSEKTNHTER